MAEAASPDVTTTQCRFCLRRDTDLVNPKQLPCSHIFCAECLTAAYDITNLVRCPACREVFDMSLDSLAPASVQHNSTNCDVCRREGVTNQPAAVYCTSCSETYCAIHLENQDEVNADHPKTGINEYRIQTRNLDPRSCTEHTEQIYSLSCKTCLILCCVKCIDGLEACTTDGASHELTSIDELVSDLQKKLSGWKVEVINKKGELSALIKSASKTVSEYEMETEEMINFLHQARDEQVNAIMLAYAAVEKRFIMERKERQLKMLTFVEEELDQKLFSLSNNRLRIDAKLHSNHQMDVITGYRETRGQTVRLINEDIPRLHLRSVVKLQKFRDTRRAPELGITEYDILISADRSQITRDHPPQSLKLLKSLDLPHCTSIYQYNGKTYFGHGNAVGRVDEDYLVTEAFITGLEGHVQDITVHDNRVYSLVNGPSMVYVHDISGKLISKWTPDYAEATKLVIVNDQIVILDQQSKWITAYSLEGQRIMCTGLPLSCDGSSTMSMCAAGTSVIFSELTPVACQVFRKGFWLSTVEHPVAVACWERTYVLVFHGSSRRVTVLDIKTGDVLSDVTLNAASRALAAHISGDILTLVVEPNNLRFYQLNW